MTQNKNHWYDGWFYDKIIAPNQDGLFGQIKSVIEDQSTIIDVGCGTGRLVFALADKSKSVLGIDLSKRNIDRANLTLLQRPNNKISFQHNNVSKLNHVGQTQYDYATLTYVIHEVNVEERIDLLNDIAKVAGKIIIGDYIAPRPDGIEGYLSKTIEFVAGKEHYRNYKSYMGQGGIYYLVSKAGLKVVEEIKGASPTNQIVICKKQ